MPYSLLCLLSSIWSVNSLETLVKAVEIILDALLIYGIIRLYGDRGVTGLTVTVMSFCFVMLFAALSGAIIDPANYANGSYGVLGKRLKPWLFGTDSIASLTVLYVIFLFNTPGWKGKWIQYGLAFLLIILAQARTSVVILGIVVLIRMILKKTKFIYIFLTAAALTGLLLNLDRFLVYFLRGGLREQY